tara:strand:+ start:2253 stop:2921 length:669 start_codon:yes stop_codon:yes gene_type:complete
MAKKEFKRKFMHPTRRKLHDMVRTGGEYEKNTTIGWESKKQEREVGDVWEDEHNRYEKHEGYTMKTGKNHESMQQIRKYLEDLNRCKNPDCDHVGKFGPTNKKLIRKTGFCINCNKKMERELRINGIYEDYEKYKVFGNMIADGLLKVDAVKQDISDLKQTYDHIGEDGKIVESYTLPRPVEEMKAEMREFVDKSMKEIEKLKEMRQECFDRIKEKNYEHIL